MKYQELKKILDIIKAEKEQRLLVDKTFIINLLEEVLSIRRSDTAKRRRKLCIMKK